MPASNADLLLLNATPHDIPALNTLIARSARTLSAGFYTPAQIESAVRYVFHVDARLVHDGSYFVVRSHDVIAGCGGWSARAALLNASPDDHGSDTRPLDPAVHPARVRAMFVAPEFARRGIGRLLLNASLDGARAAGFARVELMATLPGVPLYTAYGFEEIARESATLPDGVELPLVRMRRSTHRA